MSSRRAREEARQAKAEAIMRLSRLAAVAQEAAVALGRSKLKAVPPSTVIGYNAVHQRLRRSFGPASVHDCAECCSTRAADWAYDEADPGELIEAGLRYSLDGQHYRPLCRKCHRATRRQDLRDVRF